jgi:hypothetical protein
MAVPKGHAVVSIVVPDNLHDRLHDLAQQSGTSVSRMLCAWLVSGVDAPIKRAGKQQSVRRYKDELMISLPRDWQSRARIEAGQRVLIAYSDDALIIRP